MRRADRLFQIVQYLRGGRLITARQLAEWVGVSERTIYRDIADLIGSGVPIEGEAGVGYLMRAGYDLPPLMFTNDEIAALVAGARLIQAWGGLGMARSAREALEKIDAVLPDAPRARAAEVQIHAIAMPTLSASDRAMLDRLDEAIETRTGLSIHYQAADGKPSQRLIRPLGLWFWGKVWTLVAWCELRDDFRMFRIDRIERCDAAEPFKSEPGKDLKSFYATVQREHPDAAPHQ
ncbi:helix-turn-helix transcriptional regulator [Actibacterium lipolyticum]|uniref:HTH domain protein n=1 Tax=Actibacterium lipolyticum TaxID=1524263 RepID=A0A238KL86_9RHOB|nr:YafY family protein [Actibacterium lipolyticum]SMX43561.1 HTH domain protein [Actibacterium lipolyticum]